MLTEALAVSIDILKYLLFGALILSVLCFVISALIFYTCAKDEKMVGPFAFRVSYDKAGRKYLIAMMLSLLVIAATGVAIYSLAAPWQITEHTELRDNRGQHR